MLPLADGIDGVPADILKYILITLGWLVTVGGGVWGGARLARKGTSESPVAIGPQPFAVQKHDAPAKKSEHDTLREAVTKLTTELQSFRLQKAEDDLALSEQLAAQFNKMTTDGQARAAAISQSIAETLAIQNEKNITMATDIANHAARIMNLEKADDRHEGTVQRIQSQIAQMLANPPRKAA